MRIFSFDGSYPALDQRIVIPEDVPLIEELLSIDRSIVFGGSFVDNIYLGRYNPSIINDLDIMCSGKFIDELAKENESLKSYLNNFEKEEGHFMFYNGLMNLPSNTPQVIVIEGKKYPPQVKGIWKGKNIDCFLNSNLQHETIDWFGLVIKIAKPRERIRMLKSMLETKIKDEWLRHKQITLPKKISELRGVCKFY